MSLPKDNAITFHNNLLYETKLYTYISFDIRSSSPDNDGNKILFSHEQATSNLKKTHKKLAEKNIDKRFIGDNL